MPANGIRPMAPRTITRSFSFIKPRRNGLHSDQSQLLSEDSHLFEIGPIVGVERPFGLFSHPAETQVETRGLEPTLKIRWGSSIPAGLLVGDLALVKMRRAPGLGKGGEVDLAGGDGRRLPIDGIDLAMAEQNVVRVKLPVNDGVRWGEKDRDAF